QRPAGKEDRAPREAPPKETGLGEWGVKYIIPKADAAAFFRAIGTVFICVAVAAAFGAITGDEPTIADITFLLAIQILWKMERMQ
ncbi:hypothetical protein, partial [Sphingopyxis indica]|uniref:hypothetical protein n=1 Tax=Sphingopyxis indica TaxID=436663 RepID=UPI0014836A88